MEIEPTTTKDFKKNLYCFNDTVNDLGIITCLSDVVVLSLMLTMASRLSCMIATHFYSVAVKPRSVLEPVIAIQIQRPYTLTLQQMRSEIRMHIAASCRGSRKITRIIPNVKLKLSYQKVNPSHF